MTAAGACPSCGTDTATALAYTSPGVHCGGQLIVLHWQLCGVCGRSALRRVDRTGELPDCVPGSRPASPVCR
ncbi:hypothetical protein [Streptomyces sp. NPDC048644]|uniref:hypothetical protein n=1 Tax=Streptomyces sp. NPDC048644 TaxID=3365582 RepID=UPI0037102FA4